MKNYFSGELKLKDNLSEMDYFTYDSSKPESKSISELLNEIHTKSKSKEIYISIQYKRSNSGESHKITKQGILKRHKDRFEVECYFIDNYSLELELDELTGEYVEIFIEDFLEKADGDYIYEKRNS